MVGRWTVLREPGVGGEAGADRKRMPENERVQAETHIKGAEDYRKIRQEKKGSREEGAEKGARLKKDQQTEGDTHKASQSKA